MSLTTFVPEKQDPNFGYYLVLMWKSRIYSCKIDKVALRFSQKT